jgi:uncharacterized membrane protein
MGKNTNLVSALGVGAGLMYFLDPGRGKRRRALVRDKSKRLMTQVERAAGKTRRDLANRAQGVTTAAKSVFEFEKPPDYIVEARVRAKLGRLVEHPHFIDVTVHRGVATISGHVTGAEYTRLLNGASGVPGVSRIEDYLHVHATADEFVGNSRKSGPQSNIQLPASRTNWSPAARFFAGAAGTALAIYGIGKSGIRGTTAAAVGTGLLARSIANRELTRLFGIQTGPHVIDIRKTITIAAPVEKVFEFWANYENFPRFMSHLKEVRGMDHRRSHWVAIGPAGVTVEWDADITQLVPNRLLAWKSVAGSAIETAGMVRFGSSPEGKTRLDIHISYNPPAGAVGHLTARLFGADPKHSMNEDLVRLKSLLEVGKTRVHGETVTRDELSGVAKTLVPGEQSKPNPLVH